MTTTQIRTKRDNTVFVGGQWQTLPAGTVLQVIDRRGSYVTTDSDRWGTVDLLDRSWNIETV